MSLTPVEIAQLARNAGWTSTNDIATAVAICLAESSGTVNDVGGPNSNGTYDYGLWQINSVHAKYDRNKLLTDPAYNATAAHEIFTGSGWQAWSSYNSNAYAKYLAEGQQGASAITGATADSVALDASVPAVTTTSSGGGHSGVTGLLWYLSNGNNFWQRVGIGLGGVALLVMSVSFINGGIPGASLVAGPEAALASAAIKHKTNKAAKRSAQREANNLHIDRKRKPPKPKAKVVDAA